MRTKLFSLGTIAIAAVFFFLMDINAQGIGDRNRASSGGSHNIIGRVILPNGKPAVGVKVSLSGADFTNTGTTTDTEGNFTFGSIPGGNYKITVKAPGYQDESESLTIERFATSGQGYQLTFHLRLPGESKIPTAKSNSMLTGIPKSAVAHFEKGMEKMSKDDAKGSIPHFDEAIGAYPKFAAAYYERGAAYLKLNDLDKATESFVQAITIKPDYIEAKYGYGMAQFQKKNYEVAEAAFRDVLKEKPDMAEAHLNLGISLFHLKNGTAAEAELKTAVGSKGGEKLALGHLYLGQIYMMKKQRAEAIAELQKYVDLAPKAPNAERIKSVIAELKKQS